jgi:hypothetical protein
MKLGLVIYKISNFNNIFYLYGKVKIKNGELDSLATNPTLHIHQAPCSTQFMCG